MTNRGNTVDGAPAGHLDQDWIDACRGNESEDNTLEDWIARVHNCREVTIYEDGALHIEGPQSGVWLNQGQIDETCRLIDEGV